MKAAGLGSRSVAEARRSRREGAQSNRRRATEDTVTPAAVVEGMSFGAGCPLMGTCTFAKGVDPLMALAMSCDYLAISGGA